MTWSGAILPATAGGCGSATNASCDNFKLTITPPSAIFGPYVVEVRVQPVGDWDLEAYDPANRYLKNSGSGPNNAELVQLYNPAAGTYTIALAPFAPLVGTDGKSYTASAELKKQPPSGTAPAGSEAVSYSNHAWPAGSGKEFGEPSIGVNWKTNKVMFAGGGFPLYTLRISFNDSTFPPAATWEDVSHIWTQSPRAASDPLSFTDKDTGRTIALQLEGLTPFSTMAYTDDDGGLWVPSQGSGVASGIDHQTVGGGPFAFPLTRDPKGTLYPNAVYYCAQELVAANCALSLDGGQTFGPAVTMYTSECGGLHGHIKVSPKDGTVYVPNKGCGGTQGLALSEDNGMSWKVRTLPGSGTGDSDPSVAVASDGTVYFGFQDGDGHPKVAVTKDKGLTWQTYGGNAKFIDVGTSLGIQNIAFPAMVAGDGNRAAFAFLGTTTGGGMQDANFPGVWYLFVAHTYDGGQTWTTVNATPNDPVQRGCIWLGGGDNPCRNLLDFMDASVDRDGRVIVGFADGCTGACATSPTAITRTSWATVARQAGGRRMYAAMDPSQSPTARDDAASTASNAAVTINVLANDSDGGFPPLTVTSATTPSTGSAVVNSDSSITYTPAPSFVGTATFSYTIRNTKGLTASANVSVSVQAAQASPQCTAPGVTVMTDPAADQTGGALANQQMDITKVQMSESYTSGGMLTVTMTTSALDPATMPPNGTWRTSFTAAHADGTSTIYFVSANTNSSSNPTGVSFNYGFYDTTGASPINRTIGAADGGSLDPVKKTITVNLRLDKIRKPIGGTTGGTLTGAQVDLSAGKSVTAITGLTQLLVGVIGNGVTSTIDTTNTNGTYTFAGASACPAPPPPPPPPPPANNPTARYQVFPAPNGVGTTSGEPSIGANWFTGKVFYQSGLVTLRVGFDECVSPARATWENVSPVTSARSLDPIMVTDHTRPAGSTVPNRTIVSQLVGTDSLSSLTDDDGATWIPNQGGGIVSGVDHQTIGAGPYHQPLPANPLYPNAVYYCSQDLVNALCARSDDGGLTYGPPIPIYTSDSCGGIHGHVKVGPDGAVYVPNKTCGTDALASVIVSKDNGITWAVKKIPGSGTSGFLVDPSVAVGDDNTVYVGWQHTDGHARAAVSRDNGETWTDNIDVGAVAGVNNAVFPAMVAGEKDRASYAFLGSTTAGNYTAVGFPGIWHLYIAQTLDGGKSWSVVNATPNDPVQRGSICTLGTTACEQPPVGSRPIPDRNLLDFMDATEDGQGRMVVAIADGCTSPDCVNNGAQEYRADAVIVRQSGGKRLHSRYDTADVTAPGAPNVTALRDATGVRLSWPEPDNGGAAITNYRIYRRATGGTRTYIGDAGTTRSYRDATAVAGTAYYYSVGAVNAAGESAFCSGSEVAPVPAPDPCHLPGTSLMTDGAESGIPAALDIREAWVAEPDTLGGPDKLVWTLKVGDLSSIPANAQWYIIWDFGTGLRRYVAAKSDGSGALSYEYGHVGPPLNATSPDPDANRPFRDGAAAGSVNPFAGTFTITVLNENVGAPRAGQSLGTISPRTFLATGNTNVVSSSAVDITSITPSYTLAGNASCGTLRIPTARDDSATTQENTAVTVAVLANDSDGGAPPLTLVSVTQPANGTAIANANGTVTYNPNGNYNGGDTFSYTMKNADNVAKTANVSITIPAFCPFVPTGSFSDTFEPAAKPGWTVDTAASQVSVSPNWQVTTDPSAHTASHSFYTDAIGPSKDDRLVAPPQNLSSSSHLIFWHRYQFEDGFDGGVVEVSKDGGKTWVDAIAGGGSFVSGGYNGIISPDDASPIAARPAWTGGDVTAPMSKVDINLGAFAGLGVRVRFRMVTDALYPGVAWFVDDVEFTNLLVPTVCNHPPKAADDIASTVENNAVTINVLANDSDPDGNALTVGAVTQPAHGAVVNNGTSVKYTPAANYFGADAFTYTASDGNGGSATANVSITVSERPNVAPVASLSATPSSGDAPLNVALSGAGSSDADAGDSISSYTFNFGDGSTPVTQAGPTISHTYSAAGSFTATLVVRDQKNASSAPASKTITVTQPNRAPVAVNDSAQTAKNSAVTLNILSNDSDPDGDALSVVAVGLALNGTVANNGGGSVTYTPSNGYSGTDSFSYTIGDGHGHTASANVTITVSQSAGGPKAGGSGTVNGASFSFNMKRISYSASGVSIDGTVDSMQISGNTADFSGLCSMSSGPCTYTAHAEDNAGGDRFSIRISNGSGVQIHQNDGTVTGGDIKIR